MDAKLKLKGMNSTCTHTDQHARTQAHTHIINVKKIIFCLWGPELHDF